MLMHNVALQSLLKIKQLCLNIQRVVTVRWTTYSAGNNPSSDDTTRTTVKPFESIPHLKILPVIGTAWTFLPIIGRYEVKKQHLALQDKRRKLGIIFRDKVGSLNLVCSCNADDGQILFRNEGLYPSRGVFTSLQLYRESRKEWYSTTGVLILQGKEWHDLRTKVQKHLMKPKAAQAYLNPVQDVARDLVDKMFKMRDGNNEVPNFLGELYKWALESIAIIGLDTRLRCLDVNLSPDSDGMKMIQAVQTQFECMNALESFGPAIKLMKYFRTPLWRKFSAAGDVFTEIAFKYINQALEGLNKTSDEDRDPTLLQSMLMTKGLDASGAMVTIADMLMGGIDTTSHTVAFFLYHMARNPDKQEILHKEISNLLPKKTDRITPSIYNELRFLKACIKESQRLHPIFIGIARVLDHDAVFSGYRVPAKTIIILGLQEIFRDKRYFSNPDQYLPERWLNKDDKFHPFAFLPFGYGTRSCIGRRLAELELICLLTELIRNFRIEYHYEDIGMVLRLIGAPDKPLKYCFIER